MYLDRRLGNTPRWFIEPPEGADMRVPEEVLKSVCFLGAADIDPRNASTEVFWGGTGFFVLHQSEFDASIGHCYLVTAKHVADRLAGRSFAVRVNSKAGTAVWIEGTPKSRFFIHPSRLRKNE